MSYRPVLEAEPLSRRGAGTRAERGRRGRTGVGEGRKSVALAAAAEQRSQAGE